MTIRQIPLPPPVHIAPEASSVDALRLLIEHEFNHLPVCVRGQFVGLLGINDLLRTVIPLSARLEGGLTDLSFAGDAGGVLSGMLNQLRTAHVGTIMHQPEATLNEDCPFLEAALLLSKSNSPLPVLGKNGDLRGMLSRRVLLSYLLEHSAT